MENQMFLFSPYYFKYQRLIKSTDIMWVSKGAISSPIHTGHLCKFAVFALSRKQLIYINLPIQPSAA